MQKGMLPLNASIYPRKEASVGHLIGRLVHMSKGALAIGVVGALLVGGGMGVGLYSLLSGNGPKLEAVREYSLDIVPKDIEYGDGAVWHAWTFSGTVPGPTVTVKVGETLRIKVTNRMDMMHSFHAHMDDYSLENDGSQANLVTGMGTGGMLHPGGEYTWTFKPRMPGLYYYHTHSADAGFSPSQVVKQGLYGAIVVEDPKDPPMRQEVLFMGEIGPATEGKVAPFVMNGMGLVGGEMALETIFKEEGLAGLEQRFNKTIPMFKMKVNEPIKLHVVNIGDIEHSLYIHSARTISLGVLGGRPWPAKVVPLVQGSADTLRVEFSNPGLWLFHCHVESHADAGMLGVFEVEA